MQHIAYVRVSTTKQDVENQTTEINRYAQNNGMIINHVIESVASTRKSQKVRCLDELFALAKRGDVVLVSELSRISRSMLEFSSIAEEFHRRGIILYIIRQGLKLDGKEDIMTKALMGFLAIFAELERQQISERTKAGLARRKDLGKPLGRKEIGTEGGKMSRQRADEWADKLKPVLSGLVDQGLTLDEIKDQLNELGIRSTMGNRIHVPTLRRLLKRCGLHTKGQAHNGLARLTK